MSESFWQRAQRISDEARELDEAVRQEFIAKASAGDAMLECAIQSLLAGDDEATATSEQLAPAKSSGRAEVAQPGDVVGPFEVLDRLGEGGMASVFRARRMTDDFDQEVALKILDRRQPSDELLLRFALERQIAASLDHPNIARLIDGGVTDDGLPYFAMELVDGEPLDQYCDRAGLTIRERVRLLIEVAHAVHHAHRNLLVHRDLKPSNIYVEGDGRVRLLDFGIAKPLDPEMASSARTRTGALLLTPRYSSPEQFAGGAITTASDQYQLGLLLFELVTGHCHHLLEGEDLSSIGRRITDLDTPRPSQLLTTSGTVTAATGDRSLDEIASARQATTAELARELHGDLDTIILKTLEKDPDRRYASVEAFVEDLERFLADEPVRARPASVAYRARKFARRHRVAVSTAALGLVALVGGATVATWQAVRASRAEASARQEAATATQVSAFLVDLFEVADPGATAGEDLTAAEILQRGRDKLDSELGDQPVIRGRLLRTISRIHHYLGDFDGAVELAQEALAVHEAASGTDSLEVADDLERLAETEAGRTHFEPALELYERTLEIREAALGRDSLAVADSLAGIGRALGRLGRFDEAEAAQREALEIRLRHLDRQTVPVAHSLYYLGAIRAEQGRYADGLEMLLESAAIDRELRGAESRAYAEDLVTIATVYWQLGRFEESIATSREHLRISETLYGPEHHVSVRGLEALALNLIELARYDEAEELIQKSLTIKRRIYGPRSQEAGGALHNLGYLLQDMGRFTEAETIYREAISIRAESMGEDHPRVAELRENLAEVWVELGRLDEAEAGFRRALRDKRAKLASDHPRMSWSHWGIGLTQWRQGDLAEAETELEQARAILEAKLGPDHVDLAYSLHILANVKRDLGRYEEAEALYEKALEMRSRTSPARLVYRRTVEDFATLLEQTGRPEEARALRADRASPAQPAIASTPAAIRPATSGSASAATEQKAMRK